MMPTSSPQRQLVPTSTGNNTNAEEELSSPVEGEDHGGFHERLIIRKTSVETQTQDDSYYQRKITPRVPKRCKIAVYLATGTAVIMEPDKGSSATAKDLLDSLVESEELALSPFASDVFSIWMASSFLEVQLKPNQQPLGVRRNWKRLLHNYSTATHPEAENDEPRICLRRSAYLTKKEEVRIKDGKILELLYAEARHNILSGRYPCESDDYSTLGALQAGIEMGSFNPEIHTVDFFRQNQRQFLPEHVCEPTWIPSFILGRKKTSPSVLLLENFRRIPPTTPSRKLVRKYLELCWALPYYGSAMFHGQVESPAKGLWSFLDHPDNFVLLAINNHSLHVIDYYRNRILVGARFENIRVELGWPSHQESGPNSFPCLFLQFLPPSTEVMGVMGMGGMGSGVTSRQSKMLQIFSKQAPMMEALINRFHRAKLREEELLAAAGGDEVDSQGNHIDPNSDIDGDFLMSLKTVTEVGLESSCLTNKLGELALATFDDDGVCISQSGSWAFSQ